MSTPSVHWSKKMPSNSKLSSFDFDSFLNSGVKRERNLLDFGGHSLAGDTMRRARARRLELEQEAEDSASSTHSSDDSSDSAASSEDEKKKSKKDKDKAKGSSSSKKRRSGRRAGNDANKEGLDQLAALLGAAMKPKTSAPNDGIISDPLALPPIDSLPPPGLNASDIAQQVVQLMKQEETASRKSKPGKVGSKVAFKRVDQVYDRKIHNYKLKETVHEDPKRDEWDQVCCLEILDHEADDTVCIQRAPSIRRQLEIPGHFRRYQVEAST